MRRLLYMLVCATVLAVAAQASGAAEGDAPGEPGRVLGVITADLPPGRPVWVALAPRYRDFLKGEMTREMYVPGPGPFMIADVPPGSYLLVALVDLNGNREWDWEVDAYALQRERVVVPPGGDAGPIELDTFFNADPRGPMVPAAKERLRQQATFLYQAALALGLDPKVTDWQKRRALSLQQQLRGVLLYLDTPGTEAQHRYMFTQVAEAAAALQAAASGTDYAAAERGPVRRAVYSKRHQAPWPYSLYIPPAYDPARAWPLFVALPGAGGNPDGMLRNMCGVGPWGKRVLPAREPFPPFPERDMFLLTPYALTTDNPYNGMPESVDEVLASIDDVLADYNIDTKRIYLLGVSMGGGGVWRIGLTHPGRFAAVAPIAGTLPLAPERAGDAPKLPVLAIHGVHDHVIPIADVRAFVAKRRELGGRVVLREQADGEHYLDTFGMDGIFAELEELGATREW